KIISLLILILGVSPLLAPTVGGFVALQIGWQAVFVVLGLFALLLLVVCWQWLPQGHAPDATVSLQPGPILRNFAAVLKEPQFLTYALAGAFAFSGLLVYVAGSPIIFMEIFHVSARSFGGIFAGLSVGFIGSNQINILLLRKYSSDQIFRAALWVECLGALLFLAGTMLGWFGLATTVALLFIILFTLGLAYPNAAALAMAPFDRNIGSASSMLGFLQIGVSSIASASIGVFDSRSLAPVVWILAGTSWAGLAILVLGKRRIPKLRFVEESGASPIAH
ncbi:MAG TPA: MFS transporter, partial [Verrucomicrobiae bacterium]|nr:MFS transporter [Verrucomicrobiae bacterium]